MSEVNGKTPEQALNYLEGLGIVIQNGRPFHNIEAIQCVAILKEFIPPSENGNSSKPTDTEN